jgi:hypothetical protein
MLANGVDLKTVSTALGRATIRVTADTDAHVSPATCCNLRWRSWTAPSVAARRISQLQNGGALSISVTDL